MVAKAWQIASSQFIPASFKRSNTGQRDGGIHQPQVARGLGDARRKCGILHWPRRLGFEQLAAADAEQRQHRYRQHDDTHAAQPIEFMPPQIDGGRQPSSPVSTVAPVVVMPDMVSK